MSSIGSPIDMSLVQTAQAQQVASKARDKERARNEAARRFQDMVDLRVAGVEDADAVRELPHTDSEQAQSEHDAHALPIGRKKDGDKQPRIDIKA